MNKKVCLMQWEIVVIFMENIDIVDEFLNKNYRSPTKKEFVELGGNIIRVKREYGTYLKFLESNGYDRPTKNIKVVQVLDVRGKIIYEGALMRVAEHFNVDPTNLRLYINKKYKMLRKFYVRYRKE